MKAIIPALALALFALPGWAADDDEEERWRVSIYSPTQASLYYGAKNNDELLSLDFSCDSKVQAVSVLIREISNKAKPDNKICATLTKDGETTSICGATIPNELAGVPDMEAIVSPSLPLFGVTADEAKSLTITALKESFSIPLKRFNAARHDFAKICFGASN